MSRTLTRTALILGCDGTIGRALAVRLGKKRYHIIKTSRRKPPTSGSLHLDLSVPTSTYSLPENIDVAFICAAETSIARCRLYPDQTRMVNVLQTEILARRLHMHGARIIFLSTNYVYDGSKPYPKHHEPVSPITEYGRQKAEAEKRLLALGENVVVVRLTKVLTRQIPWLDEWIQLLQNGRPIHPFSNRVLPPISLEFVTDVLAKLVDTPHSGILQLSGAADVTYATLAKRIACHLDADLALVQPINYTDGVQDYVGSLPQHLTLDASLVQRLLRLTPPSVDDVVRAVLNEEVADYASRR